MYSYGSPHMAAQKQDDEPERTFSSYVRIQVVVLKTYLGRWTIGRSGERESGISVLPARYDDDDDDTNSMWINFQQIYLTLKWDLKQVLPLQFREDLGVIAHSSKGLGLGPYHLVGWLVGFVSFFLMVHHPSYLIYSQSHSCKRTLIQFNP